MVTPVAVQVETAVELAATALIVTVQVPYRNFDIVVPPLPKLAKVEEALATTALAVVSVPSVVMSLPIVVVAITALTAKTPAIKDAAAICQK